MTALGAAIISRNARALGWIATAFGATIIASHVESGSTRWTAAAWTYALEVPGSPATWGAVILAAGLALLYGCRRESIRARLLGARIAFLWFCALDAAAVLAFTSDMLDNPVDTVNPLAVIAWTCFAVMYRLHIKDENRRA
ncbi:M6 family metalloprotease domain protein, precursor [Mycolicibacterium canariasense]|uniref:M6 family metalloprotease domain protein n=1 Tax=Mycolicibacterium canariasense TaxID=228230 RepID=A0A100WIT4_MYCCR|nr:hypothetical protein [Mycolicibacterium canariasense]MCV7213157.1 hypothetical protein [Mycolicibacterium canariasense]ORU98489.1 hypothetical protein AWB94_28520 [Mycolicibacterium canariasense]GAS98881.1 M6 family metalloprotease domain protein, precursor [Mycolicibacterium canariasense]